MGASCTVKSWANHLRVKSWVYYLQLNHRCITYSEIMGLSLTVQFLLSPWSTFYLMVPPTISLNHCIHSYLILKHIGPTSLCTIFFHYSLTCNYFYIFHKSGPIVPYTYLAQAFFHYLILAPSRFISFPLSQSGITSSMHYAHWCNLAKLLK